MHILIIANYYYLKFDFKENIAALSIEGDKNFPFAFSNIVQYDCILILVSAHSTLCRQERKDSTKRFFLFNLTAEKIIHPSVVEYKKSHRQMQLLCSLQSVFEQTYLGYCLIERFFMCSLRNKRWK